MSRTAGVGINTNNFARCLPGMYRIPKVDVGIACYFTNKVPIGPYRGAGRPEANFALERVVEEAARVTGIDSVRLRKKNLIPPSAMPYKTAIGNTYDSGDFPGIVAQALDACRLRQFQQAQARGGAPQEISRHRRLLHAGARRLASRSNSPRSAFPAATSSSSAATCNRPARATPPCSAACWPASSASTPARSSTGTATPRSA